MEAPPDWDLLAVVRSCSFTTTASTTFSTAEDLPPPPQQLPCHPLPQLTFQQQPCFSQTTPSTCSPSSALFGFSGPLNTTSFGLHDICQPLTTSTTTSLSNNNNNLMHMSMSMNNSTNSLQSISSSSPSVISLGKISMNPQQSQFRRLIKPSPSSQVIFGASSPTTGGGTTTQSQRTKKRKNLMKKVCHVPAEGLSNDMWAWRKYGQKPIKGSPYPRGYYRCSSSKGCLARKQVERNRSDPKMFIVTYTSEHNHPMPTHRNSLAGSTRQKTVGTTVNATATTPEQQTSCSSPSAASLSPLMEEKVESKTEGEDMVIKDEDNDMESLSDLILNDDFYVGFDQIDGGSSDSDCFSDQFSPSSEFPWLSSGGSSTATAAGGS